MNKAADIPSTIKFQEELGKLQKEYKTALETGEHPEKELMLHPEIVCGYYDTKCRDIYEIKLNRLVWKIVKEHDNPKIDLLNYQHFKDLVWDALYKTGTFLNSN